MAEEAIHIPLVGSGSGQKEPRPMRVYWALKKRPVIAHTKTRSKHSSLTINCWHLKKPIMTCGRVSSLVPVQRVCAL